ncbi:phage holin, LLH family [Paenibacillus elgii]|uniref:phage holin, LLH family n=1 Tax=Paenibacillus elgii TaxID=189691 RepID=UPI000248D6B9|nr:phage holin, LLH family [Paenibacillus elgii]
MDFQPFISEAVQALVGLVSLAAITVFFKLKKHFIGWIDSKTTGQQRETLHRVAEEAFAIVETSMSGQQGDSKLNAAIDYASKNLADMGIQVQPTAMRAAIEKAVLAHKAQAAQIVATSGAPAEQPQTSPLPDHVQNLLAAAAAFTMAENQGVEAPQPTASTAPVESPTQTPVEPPAPTPAPAPTPTTWA